LWNARTGAKLREFAVEPQGPHFYSEPQGIHSIAFSGDVSQIATGSYDGATRIWSVATGQELAKLISIDAGNDWLVVTPDGVFDCSVGGRRFIRFRDPHDPMKVLPVEAGFAAYYHPHLLADILAGHAVGPPDLKKDHPAAGK
jgi:WD40 repeat protein